MKLYPPVKSLEERSKEGFGKNDILKRNNTGSALSELLNSIDEPLVVALDGKWGTGKTWFLQGWVGEHSKIPKNNSTVVYFDAFAHDYLSDPLPSLVSALADSTESRNRNIQRIKKMAFKLAKTVVRTSLRAGLAASTVGTSEIINTSIKAIGSELEKNIDKYWKAEEGKTVAMQGFRKALKSLATEKKVIFVIDELDRCRPDYALELLEVIKHFFSVSNVQFVLGVNLEALEDMVSVRYGKGNKDNEIKTYLQKFIQVTLNLPHEIEGEERYVNQYLNWLCEEMKVLFEVSDRLKWQVKNIAQANPNSISLRHVEHIVSSINLASGKILDKKNIPRGMYWVMNDLIISRIVRPDLYPKFLEATISDAELREYFGVKEKILKGENSNEIDLNQKPYSIYHYELWYYISYNKFPEGIKFSMSDTITQELFDVRYGFPESHVGHLPKIIQRDWLDIFQFYRPPLK